MRPQVGQVYNTTSAWNSWAEPREIVNITDDNNGIVIHYRILNQGARMTHSLSVDTFYRTIERGAWCLQVPIMLRLPQGA